VAVVRVITTLIYSLHSSTRVIQQLVCSTELGSGRCRTVRGVLGIDYSCEERLSLVSTSFVAFLNSDSPSSEKRECRYRKQKKEAERSPPSGNYIFQEKVNS
jgi:hypothetical protein